MAEETARPVSGVMTRYRPDGSREEIQLTAEELAAAEQHYDGVDLQRIVVTMSNGEQVRPWRFVEMNPQLRFETDPETGMTTVTI